MNDYDTSKNWDSAHRDWNDTFNDWVDHIATNLNTRSPTCGQRYTKGKDRDLLALCRNHASRYQRPTDGRDIIMLTHPFYLQFSEMDKVWRTDMVRKEANKYLNTLSKLLNSNLDRTKVGIVALDTIHLYAAATSVLLYMGLIDRVIFTWYDYGYPLNAGELKTFKKSNIFFGGGFNGRCLTHSIASMEKKASPEQIWAIKELVLNPPEKCSKTLRTSEVKGVSASRAIPLDEVVRRFDISHQEEGKRSKPIKKLYKHFKILF